MGKLVSMTSGSIEDFEFAEESTQLPQLRICRRNQHTCHKKQMYHTSKHRARRHFHCHVTFGLQGTQLSEIKRHGLYCIPYISAVTTCTHLPTNRQTCSQRSQWRRAKALARKTKLSTVERGHQMDG